MCHLLRAMHLMTRMVHLITEDIEVVLMVQMPGQTIKEALMEATLFHSVIVDYVIFLAMILAFVVSSLNS